ncbi:MAG: (2Fe-2S)-binding protein, partial [Deltaproteobacteria bacterium]|nr:(2Fe-2S)-binding protein [Deltaproteobacteria bacterium]
MSGRERTLVRLSIDGREVVASDRATILDVARREHITIPTLCYDPHLAPFGACRVCMVGVAGAKGPVPACTTLVREGMVVDTRDERALRVARGVVELVLSDYPEGALAREGDRNELREVAKHLGVTASRYVGERHS